VKEEGLVASCGFSRFVFSLSFFPFRVLRFYIHGHDHIIIRAIYLDPLSSFYTAFDDLIAIDRAVLERLMILIHDASMSLFFRESMMHRN